MGNFAAYYCNFNYYAQMSAHQSTFLLGLGGKGNFRNRKVDSKSKEMQYNKSQLYTHCYIQQIPPKKPVKSLKCSTFPFRTLRKSPQSTLLCASINISAVGCHVFIKYKYFVENKMSEMSSSYEPFQKAIISHFSCRFMTAGRKLFAMKIRLLHLKQFIIMYLNIVKENRSIA